MWTGRVSRRSLSVIRYPLSVRDEQRQPAYRITDNALERAAHRSYGPPAMAIYLIRHGETDSNAARIVQTPDVPLSTRGLAQAGRAADRLAKLGVGAILSSDLRRAVMTADRLNASTGAPTTFDAGLQERNYGDIRGQAYATLGVN